MQPYFDSFSDFLAMGGYAMFVWSSWGAVMLAVSGLILYSLRERHIACLRILQIQSRTAQKQPTLVHLQQSPQHRLSAKKTEISMPSNAPKSSRSSESSRSFKSEVDREKHL